MQVLSRFSHFRLFATLWTVARQAQLFMGSSRQEYWSELPCSPPGNLPDPGISYLLNWHVGSLPLAPPGKPTHNITTINNEDQLYCIMFTSKIYKLFQLYFLIDRKLLQNFVLVSAVQQHKSVIIIYISLTLLSLPPLSDPTSLSQYRAPFWPPCVI